MRAFDSGLSEEFRNNEIQLSRVIIELNGKIIDDTFYGGEHLLLKADQSTLTYDRLNEARTTGTFTFIALTDTGEDTLDPVAGAILYPMAGTVVNGVQTWAPLGKLMIQDTSVILMAEAKQITVQLVDMSEKVRDNKWKQLFQTGGGTYKAAIDAILTDRAPALAPYSFFLYTYSGTAPTQSYTDTDDPWSAVWNLAASSRSEIWLDKNGYLVYDQVPDPLTLRPVYELGGNNFQTEVARREMRVSRREVVNGVIVRGEAPWLLFPISGEFWDTNPASPTYRFGPMGEKPYIMGDPIATSSPQCGEIAETEYRKRAGIVEQVTFNMLKDPILEVGDMVAIKDDVDDQDRFFIIDSLNFPLGVQPMSGEIRRRRL